MPTHSHPLLNPVQPRTIHSNLIINLICLARNPLNMLILRIDFLTHRATEMIKTLGRSVQSI